MKNTKNTICIALLMVFGVTSSSFAQTTKDAPSSRERGQYNMSLQDKVVTGPKGSLTSPVAASADKLGQMEKKHVRKIADGIYRIAGWGIANIIAVEAPEGWIIVDTGDYLEVAQEQRRFLEDKVGKVKVAAVLYTHSHYAIGAKAWQDKNTRFYGHEELVATLNGDLG